MGGSSGGGGGTSPTAPWPAETGSVKVDATVAVAGSPEGGNKRYYGIGEDAATFRGGSSATFLVDGGGARSASDKVFQHNGGGTVTIRNFQVSTSGKLYRSCGKCSTQYQSAAPGAYGRARAPSPSALAAMMPSRMTTAGIGSLSSGAALLSRSSLG